MLSEQKYEQEKLRSAEESRAKMRRWWGQEQFPRSSCRPRGSKGSGHALWGVTGFLARNQYDTIKAGVQICGVFMTICWTKRGSLWPKDLLWTLMARQVLTGSSCLSMRPTEVILVLLNYQVTDSFNNHCTFGLLTITLCNARSASSMTKGAKGVDKAGNNWTSIDIWAGGDYMYKQFDWFIRKWI